MSDGRRRGWWLAGDLGAVVAVLSAVVTYCCTALADNPDRLHAFGCTIILHRGGEVVIRTPSNHLHATHLFEAIEPSWIWAAASTYLFAWICVRIAMAISKRAAKAKRGFPLD